MEKTFQVPRIIPNGERPVISYDVVDEKGNLIESLKTKHDVTNEGLVYAFNLRADFELWKHRILADDPIVREALQNIRKMRYGNS